MKYEFDEAAARAIANARWAPCRENSGYSLSNRFFEGALWQHQQLVPILMENDSVIKNLLQALEPIVANLSLSEKNDETRKNFEKLKERYEAKG